MAETTLLFFSMLLTLGAYGEYYLDIGNAKIAPNRWSWLIWGATSGMEVLTFHAVANDLQTTIVFAAPAAATIFVTVILWKRSTWQAPTRTETLCVVLSLVALILWLGFHEEWWAHLLMIVAVPISFLPMYQSVWRDYRSENSPSWALWTIGDLLALLYVSMRYDDVRELPYAAVETAAHAGVWFLVFYQSRRAPAKAGNKGALGATE
jgi:hypothetical protein